MNAKNVKVKLEVDGDLTLGTTLNTTTQPKNEDDLLQIDGYKEWYYSIGIGAPVIAHVNVYNNGVLEKEYSFQYEIHGRQMSMEKYQSIIEKYNRASTCEQFHVASDGHWIQIFSFKEKSAYLSMNEEMEGYANIGVYGGIMRDRNLLILRLEFYPQLV